VKGREGGVDWEKEGVGERGGKGGGEKGKGEEGEVN